jgi:hypothetical protein
VQKQRLEIAILKEEEGKEVHCEDLPKRKHATKVYKRYQRDVYIAEKTVDVPMVQCFGCEKEIRCDSIFARSREIFEGSTRMGWMMFCNDNCFHEKHEAGLEPPVYYRRMMFRPRETATLP